MATAIRGQQHVYGMRLQTHELFCDNILCYIQKINVRINAVSMQAYTTTTKIDKSTPVTEMIHLPVAWIDKVVCKVV